MQFESSILNDNGNMNNITINLIKEATPEGRALDIGASSVAKAYYGRSKHAHYINETG
jgi:hypothetical protein